MGDWSLGSVHDTILDLVEGVPSSLSGTRLLEMTDRKRDFVEQSTGQTIGSNSIALKYQDTITNLTISQLLSTMRAIGVDATSVRIGDFQVGQGKDNNLDAAASRFDNLGTESLKELGRRISFFKAHG